MYYHFDQYILQEILNGFSILMYRPDPYSTKFWNRVRIRTHFKTRPLFLMRQFELLVKPTLKVFKINDCSTLAISIIKKLYLLNLISFLKLFVFFAQGEHSCSCSCCAVCMFYLQKYSSNYIYLVYHVHKLHVKRVSLF